MKKENREGEYSLKWKSSCTARQYKDFSISNSDLCSQVNSARFFSSSQYGFNIEYCSKKLRKTSSSGSGGSLFTRIGAGGLFLFENLA